MIYYKIVDYEDGKIKTLFHGINRSRVIPGGKWLKATKKIVNYGSNGTPLKAKHGAMYKVKPGFDPRKWNWVEDIRTLIAKDDFDYELDSARHYCYVIKHYPFRIGITTDSQVSVMFNPKPKWYRSGIEVCHAFGKNTNNLFEDLEKAIYKRTLLAEKLRAAEIYKNCEFPK